MGTLVACYLIAWMAIMLFVVRLGITQTRLKRNLDRMQQRIDRE